MQRKPRALPLLIAALVATVLVLSAGWLLSPEPKQAQRLPDGSFLTLEAVTLDQQVDVVQANRLQSLLFPLLPTAVRKRLGWKVRSYQSIQPGVLTFWTSRRPLLRGTGWSRQKTRAVAIDEHGCEAEADIIGQSFRPNAPVVDEFWEALHYPRRGSRVGLRIYTLQPGGRWARTAEFTAPNPAHVPHPEWKAEPLPATRRSGDLAVTLTGLTSGVAQDDPTRAAWPDDVPRTVATFRISERGVPTTTWENLAPLLSDATGNTWSPGSGAHYQGSELHVNFPGRLWPDESAFKLRIPFERSFDRERTFAPEELWSTGSLDVDPSARTHPPWPSATRKGTRLRLLLGWEDNNVLVAAVQTQGLAPGVDLKLLRAVDERGRAVRTLGGGSDAAMSNGSMRHFCLVMPAGARRLALTFVLFKRERRTLEWVVKPVQR